MHQGVKVVAGRALTAGCRLQQVHTVHSTQFTALTSQQRRGMGDVTAFRTMVVSVVSTVLHVKKSAYHL